MYYSAFNYIMFLSRPIYPLDLTVDLDLRMILVWDHGESNNTKPKSLSISNIWASPNEIND